MVQLFKDFWDKFIDEKNKYASSGGILYGWAIGVYVLLQSPGISLIFTWVFLIKTIIGICISVVTAMAVLITKDWYTIDLKPRIFKKKLNEKETDNKRAA